MIRSITLCGFRGVVHRLPIPLVKNGAPASLMIFGRNGTGKSSITDGWEWFHGGTIAHLAREGAMGGAYPSRLPGGATPSEGYVEVEFDDPAGGTVRQTLGGRTPVSTNPSGQAWFRQRTTHPCHIRFEDLTRFVYLTKTERFDALAGLMGFKEQVEFQKQLRRVQSKVEEQLTSARRDLNNQSAATATHFKLSSADAATEQAVLNRLAGLFKRHGIGTVTTWAHVDAARANLAARLENDERATELKDVEALARALDRLAVSDVASALTTYVASLAKFRAQERATVADVLLGLYEKGEAAVDRQRAMGWTGSTDICPLCGQRYDGDLLAHIHTELQALSAVRAARDAADGARTDAWNLVPAKPAFASDVARAVADAGVSSAQFDTDALAAACAAFDVLLTDLRRDLKSKPETLSDDAVGRIVAFEAPLADAARTLSAERARVREAVLARIDALSADGTRAALVEDHGKVVRGLELWAALQKAQRRVAALTQCYDEYSALVERYVAMNVNDVETRFAAISADVDRYFGILEAHTEGVAHPALKLLRDQDRAVILEVEFRGERVAPAYSYLSESQLNSFGLAVFLASVRHINTEFRVVMLDDVVNSFDAYKRPQMIRLFKPEFSDFQVIVLTHDDVWWAEFIDQCPHWARLRIKRYEPGIGPILDTAKSELEMVQDYLHDDEPTQAARTLGPMLERKFQALGEAMQVSVTYNARNEYTLRPLLQSIVTRTKEKLGDKHPLYIATKKLEENTTFRNFSAHWKNPASGLTSPEVREVVTDWLAVESYVRCPQPTCGTFTVWHSGMKHFACGCGTTVVGKHAPGAPGAVAPLGVQGFGTSV